MLLGAVEMCKNLSEVWRVVGYFLFIFKIVVPLLLIIFGMLDLGKAVVGSKDDDIKKAIKQLAMRAVAAIIIFLIPTLVSFVIGLVAGFNDDEELKADYNVCRTCITSPSQCPKSSK